MFLNDTNFTWQELYGTIAAFITCPFTFFLPGWAIGWTSNIFRFRKLSLLGRLATSICLSLAVGPVIAYLLAKVAGLIFSRALFLLFGSTTIIFICLKLKNPALLIASFASELKNNWIVIAAIIFWTILCPFMLVDWQIGNHLHISVALFDWSRNVMVGDSLCITGVPPDNFFFCCIVYCGDKTF